VHVFHFVKRDFGIEDIQLRRLKVATINDLNDPFELLGPASPVRKIRQRFENVKQKLAQHVGLLCFSRKWSNPVQWSHYAEGHRGLCLGFDIPDDCLQTVAYKRKRLDPDLNALEGDWDAAGPEMRRVLATKFSHWRYENEERCFLSLDKCISERGLFFASFSDDIVLREVIVGHLCTLTRAELDDALGALSSQITKRKARLAFGSFSVVRQRDPRLWV
jgi:hypothetical protein